MLIDFDFEFFVIVFFTCAVLKVVIILITTSCDYCLHFTLCTGLHLCCGYLCCRVSSESMKGFSIFWQRGDRVTSSRAQPSANESHIYKVPPHNGRLFHMGEVSKLWRKIMVNNCQVFILSDCAVVFQM